ncbi:MAG: hypothetical protein ACI9WC_001461 [Arenicella sp.]|jgi:hypothetical protein
MAEMPIMQEQLWAFHPEHKKASVEHRSTLAWF